MSTVISNYFNNIFTLEAPKTHKKGVPLWDTPLSCIIYSVRPDFYPI